MRIFSNKSRRRMILDHHAEVEQLRQERDDARGIVSTQMAQIGALSQSIEDFRRVAAQRGERARAAEQRAAILRESCQGLADRWERLGHAGSYGMASVELLGLLQQLGEYTPDGTRAGSGT